MKKIILPIVIVVVVIGILACLQAAEFSVTNRESTTTSQIAADTESVSQEEETAASPKEFLLIENAAGKYELASEGQEGETIAAASVSGDDILCSSDEQYFKKNNDGTYVPVKRIALNTEDFDANYPIFEEYNVSKEIIQSAKETIESQQEVDNPDFSYAIYVEE